MAEWSDTPAIYLPVLCMLKLPITDQFSGPAKVIGQVCVFACNWTIWPRHLACWFTITV